MAKKFKGTREEWLQAFTNAARPHFKAAGTALPKKVLTSVGFPSAGQRSKVIGECWYASASDNKVSEIFLRPSLQADSRRIAGVLVHELCHAALPEGTAHGPAFKKLATALGLGGKMTATIETDAFYAWADPIIKELGAFPGANLNDKSTLEGGKKKQSTRMVKCECQDCGLVFRTTQKWVDKAEEFQCPDPSCSGTIITGAS